MAALLDMQKIVAIIQAKGKVLKIDFALHNSFHYFTSVFSLYTNFETVSEKSAEQLTTARLISVNVILP